MCCTLADVYGSKDKLKKDVLFLWFSQQQFVSTAQKNVILSFYIPFYF